MRRKKDTIRLNRAITCPEVRLIMPDGEQAGVVPIQEALRIATEAGEDLVEISPNSAPPVCRVMNYGKFKFQQSKKRQDAKRKQKTIQVKEIKFRPRIDEHDFMTKVKHIRKFIENGDKVRAFVHFRGREMAHRDIGSKLLERVIELLEEVALVERKPLMEGNQMAMILIPQAPAAKKKA